MPTLEQQNDQNRLKRIIEMFDVMVKLEFQTEQGKEFSTKLFGCVNELIKPEARKVYKELQ